MAKVLLALLCVAIVQTAVALLCYRCDTSKGVSCNYGLLWFTSSSNECQVQISGSDLLDTLPSMFPLNCVKLVGKDRDGNEYMAKGCAQSTGPVKDCYTIAKMLGFAEQKELESLDCFTCDLDKCNFA